MYSSTRETRADAARGIVCGAAVYCDLSGGQGHCWRRCGIPAHIAEEIAAEMLDGGKDECDDYTASNGQHYRW